MADRLLTGIRSSLLRVVWWDGHFVPYYVFGKFPLASVLGVGYSRYESLGRDLDQPHPPTGSAER